MRQIAVLAATVALGLTASVAPASAISLSELGELFGKDARL